MIRAEDLRHHVGATIDDDDLLLELEAAAIEDIEGATNRYFGPIVAASPFVQILQGTGTARLYLDEVPEDPLPSAVKERAYEGATSTDLLAGQPEGYDIRTDETRPAHSRGVAWLHRRDGMVWDRSMEYLVTYEAGYAWVDELENELAAPEEIRQAVKELVGILWKHDERGGGNLTSESIADYSYTLGNVLDEAASPFLSRVIARWRRNSSG